MFVLRLLSEREPASSSVASLGLLDPHPPAGKLRCYDFGLGKLVAFEAPSVLAAMELDPPRASFCPRLSSGRQIERLAANRDRGLRLVAKRSLLPPQPPELSGYELYASEAARFWRKHGFGEQPLLAAGVFSLSSIQTGIGAALRLFSLLGPHVLADRLPAKPKLAEIVKASGAGLDDVHTGRPAWYHELDLWRPSVLAAQSAGARDDNLRRQLALGEGMALPMGLGLAKLSFTLAILGANLGCLDSRILAWALSAEAQRRFEKRVQKRGPGRYSEFGYATYRRLELSLLQRPPFFDPDDPVGLARAQWMLWESLGPEQERYHSHEELFEAVLEPRMLWQL